MCISVCSCFVFCTAISKSLHPLKIFLSHYEKIKNKCRNSRELGLGLRYPTRDTQKQLFRWLFMIAYLIQGSLFSAVLVNVTDDSKKWVINVGFDFVLIFIFGVYFNNVHNQNVSTMLNENI